jgi:hypothetical protein
MTAEWYWKKRHRENEESQTKAVHAREPWTDDEVDFILEWDGRDREELRVAAELLGRTILACEQRYYGVLAGRFPRYGYSASASKTRIRTTTATTTTTTTTTEHRWDPEDDPNGWYVKG